MVDGLVKLEQPKKMISKLNFKCLKQLSLKTQAVTLLELLIVLMIIGLLLTAAVKTMDVSLQRSRFNTTVKEMENLSWAIAGNPDLISGGKRSDFGYVGDLGILPPTLRDLYENYNNFPAWRGPYIKSAFQESPQSYMMDAWGDTYIYPNPNTIIDTSPVYVRSYAGGSAATSETWLTKIVANRMRDLLNNTVAGNVYDAKGNPIGSSPLDIAYMKIYYPKLGRMDSFPWTCDTSTKSYFEISAIPVGNHRIKAIAEHYSIPVIRDSVEQYICVYPRVGATDIEIRFPAIRFGED